MLAVGLKLWVCVFGLGCGSASFGRRGSLCCSCRRKRRGLSSLFLLLVCRRILDSPHLCILDRTTMRRSLSAAGRSTIVVCPFRVFRRGALACLLGFPQDRNILSVPRLFCICWRIDRIEGRWVFVAVLPVNWRLVGFRRGFGSFFAKLFLVLNGCSLGKCLVDLKLKVSECYRFGICPID